MSDTQTSSEAGYGESPLAGMDAEMAANPQTVFKLIRDEMPVMPLDLPSGKGVLLRARQRSWRRSAIPRSSRRTWTPSISRTSAP